MAETPITDYNKLSEESKAAVAANAKAQGVTPQQYLSSRGGIFESGYYGDTPSFRRLSGSAYTEAAEKGTGAINTALFNQIKEAYQKNPDLIEDPYLRLAFQSGRATIDQIMQSQFPGMVGKMGFGTQIQNAGFRPIGVSADGTPIYGFDSKGNPVTSPTGTIYSTVSSTDAVARANSGGAPLVAGSFTPETGTGFGADSKFSERQSAFNLLLEQFNQYGLGSLVEPLRSLIISGVPASEFAIRLRETDAYKKRFAANQARINKGLRALSEAEYINLEDQYQDTMRRYGLPPAYYARGDMGRQEGFEKFIGGDVSPTELEDRIQTAQRRVINANPEVAASLRSFYPEIGQGDLLAYFLDPDKAIENIRRKVTAAEIGGAAAMAGLTVGGIAARDVEAQMRRAQELGAYGVTGEAARQGFQTVAEVAPRGSQLAEIYKQTPYTQATAEAEVFGLGGAVEAGRQRRKLTELERASFAGTSGATAGALARDRAGAF